MSVCCECCVLSGRGLCDELIARPEESYRMWCVVEGYLETKILYKNVKYSQTQLYILLHYKSNYMFRPNL
jgi:hypothetical protein